MNTDTPQPTASAFDLPHYEQAEAAILADIINTEGQTLDTVVKRGVSAESFYEPELENIFKSILSLKAQGQPIDEMGVFIEAKRYNGDTSTRVIEITSKYKPNAQLLSRNIELVRNAENTRKFFKLTEEWRQRVIGGWIHPNEAFALAHQEAETFHESIRTASNDRPSWWPVSASEALQKPQELPPQLLREMLYEGGTMLLAGPSKSMKTWTMIALAVATASGAEWMGAKAQACPVLYLNLELPRYVFERRVMAVCKAMALPYPERLYTIHTRTAGITTDLRWIEANLPVVMQDVGAKMLIIDPHYKISACSGYEENSNDGQGMLLARLESLTSSRQCALVIAHHFAKGNASDKSAIDRASGGGVFARWPDAFVSMTPHEEDGAMSIEFTLRAFKQPPAVVVRWEYPVWMVDETLDPAKLKKPGGKRPSKSDEEILAAIPQEGIKSSALAEKLGIGTSTLHERLGKMERSGKVKRTHGMVFKV
jgi:RecA-family ATPase